MEAFGLKVVTEVQIYHENQLQGLIMVSKRIPSNEKESTQIVQDYTFKGSFERSHMIRLLRVEKTD